MARSYRVDVNIDDPSNAVWFQRAGQRDQNTFFPDTIYGEASFDLNVYFWHGDVDKDGNPETGTTPANFESGDGLTLYGRIEDQPSGVAPTTLATGTFNIGENNILFDVQPDVVPNEWSRVDTSTTGKYPIAVWFTGLHEGDELTAKTNVIVIDKDHVGTGDALILDASNLTYTPANPSDWTVTPTLMNEGLDELAERVKAIEDNPSSGDMAKSVYDPQLIEADAFDLANMTGLITHDRISDFDDALANSSVITGTVTIHSDVSSAGSGQIITATERTNLTSATAHVSSTSNPHSVNADDVGRTVAQWYASHIHTSSIDDPLTDATDQYVATWDATTSTIKWVAPPGLGGGETNDLQLDPDATGEDIRVTKTGSTIFTKGILGTGNVASSTVGDDIVLNVPTAAEGTTGCAPIASQATVDTGTDDAQIVTSLKLQSKLGAYCLKREVPKITSGAYTLIQDDESTPLFIDDALTIPTLIAGTNMAVFNKSSSQVAITLSGVTCENSTDLNIAPKGTISVFYEDATTVWLDGNLEA